jgi:hypothetical protein
MWICRNCGTENEDNFKFWWSCGQTRERSKPVEIKEQVKEIPKKPEPKREPIREIRKVEEIKPAEITKTEPRKNPQNEPEFFATVLPHSARNFNSNDETDWEIKVFRIAVRLVGLFLLYQVIVALPDLVVLIHSSVKNTQNFSDALTSDLIISTAKTLFYFIVGVYLIVRR